MDLRIKDFLTEAAIKDYEYLIAADKDGISSAVKMTLETATRQAITLALGSIGGAVSADYDGVDIITVNATGTSDLVITPSNVPENQTVKLVVTRATPVSQAITFAGVTGTVDGKQSDSSTVYFDVWKQGASIIVSQVNSQFGGNIIEADLSMAGSTITTFNYFRYEINDNVCNFWADFDFQYTGVLGVNKLTLTIANWDINTVQDEVSISTFLEGDTGITAAMGKTSNTSADIWFNVQPATNDTNNLKFSGSFKIT